MTAKNRSKFGSLAFAASVVFILATYLFLTLPGLGALPYWHDEAQTSIFAKNILSTGLPYVQYGKNFGAVTFYEAGKHGLESGHGWLSWYVCALGYLIFGIGDWAGRIPFILCGALTVLLVILISRKWYGNIPGLFAGAILAIHPVYLQYSRQARYYTTAMLLFTACLAVYAWAKRGRLHWAWLCGLCPLLFHSFPLFCGVFFVSIWILDAGGYISSGMMDDQSQKSLPWTKIALVCAGLLLPWIYLFDLVGTLLNPPPMGNIGGNPGVVRTFFDAIWTSYMLFPILMLPGLAPVERRKVPYAPVTFAVISLLVIALVPSQVYSVAGGIMLRYFIFVIPLGAIVCARGIALLGQRRSWAKTTVSVILIVMAGLLFAPSEDVDDATNSGFGRLLQYGVQLERGWRYFHNPVDPDPERTTFDLIAQHADTVNAVYVSRNGYFQTVNRLGPNKRIEEIQANLVFEFGRQTESFLVIFDSTAFEWLANQEMDPVREKCELLEDRPGFGFQWRNYAESPVYYLDESEIPETFIKIYGCERSL
jgi:dolichyl-phosphate-mannose-protein mannosyltransferase